MIIEKCVNIPKNILRNSTVKKLGFVILSTSYLYIAYYY